MEGKGPERTEEQNIEKNEAKVENKEQFDKELKDIENSLNPSNSDSKQENTEPKENKENTIETNEGDSGNNEDFENYLKSIEDDLKPNSINEGNDENIRDISKLKDTENFQPGAIEHIFEGEINAKGKAVGYHYEGMDSSRGSIVEGTETEPNDKGIYEAMVEVDGVEKKSNGGKSSFFPKDMTPQEVVDSINQAYNSRQHDVGNTYYGFDDNGIEIGMYINEDTDKIKSAFPVYDDGEEG